MRPRIAIIVANGIDGDSRVIKTAVSAWRGGAEVLLLGTTTGPDPVFDSLEDIRVVRVLPASTVSRSLCPLSMRDRRLLIRPLAMVAFRSADHYGRAAIRRAARREATRMRIDERKRRLQAPGGGSSCTLVDRSMVNAERLRSFTLDAWFVARRAGLLRPPFTLGRREPSSGLEHLIRRRFPVAGGYVDAMASVLADFDPDLIHAHDIFMAPVAATYVEDAAVRGREVKWVYDAHEWVAGLRAEAETVKTSVADEIERLIAPSADRVVTVGEALADELVDSLELRTRPIVVLNAPPRWSNQTVSAENVRSRLGLPDVVPLLVYPGVVKPKRGLDTVVDALPVLQDVHLAVMADLSSQHVRDLRRRAESLCVSERVHFLPYVAPDQIAAFIRSATIGIYPLRRYPNADVALPTKLLEFVQAGLPVVTSDTTEMADFVRAHAIGEVFTSGSADAFARAVRRVLEDHAQYVVSYQGELAELYCWERQEGVLLSVYEDLLGCDFKAPTEPFRIPASSEVTWHRS